MQRRTLKTHIKHTVGLVENEEFDVGKGDPSSLKEVDESSGGGREEVASSLDLPELLSNVGTSVDDGGLDPRSVGELPRLVVDLGDELSSGSEDEGSRVGLSARVSGVGVASVGGRRGSLGTGGEGGGEDGEEETAGLSRTGLGAGHEVSTTGDDGDGVLLDGGRGGVSGRVDVLDQDRVEGRAGELGDGLGDVSTGSLDGDRLVLVEVDSGVLEKRKNGG
jgi:hypothetical protein